MEIILINSFVLAWLFYIGISEILTLKKTITRNKYVYGNLDHSREHFIIIILILLCGLLMNIYSYWKMDISFYLYVFINTVFIIPHLSKEGNGDI